MELRAARGSDLDAAAAWLGLEAPPPSWTDELEAGASWAVEEGGAPAGLVLVRPWGRVLCAPVLVVDPARRGRAHGRRLVAGLREEALRRGARSVGLEADPFDAESLAALVRCGFKLGPPALELEWPGAGPAEPAEESEGEPPTEDAAERAGAGDRAEPSLDELAALASALDAALEPSEWIARRRAAGAALVASRSERGGLRSAALVEPAEDGPARCPILLLDESEPFDGLGALREELDAAGVGALSLVAPARQSDALRALLRAGARPGALRLRLSLEGFPQRADLRRAVLASWR